jgi:hypothetical protein
MGDIVLTGPLFDGRSTAEAAAMLDDVVTDVGRQGYSLVMGRLNQTLQHPTPYYETQVVTQPLGPAEAHVHDRGIVYGPWLEGVGSRNQTSRFKGYHNWRLATQDLEQQVPALADAAVRRHLPAMGG